MRCGSDGVAHDFGVAGFEGAGELAEDVVLAKGGGIFEDGDEAAAIEIRGRHELCEGGERGVDVHIFSERVGGGAGLLQAGGADHERDVGIEFEVGGFAPMIGLAERVAMIAEQDDDGIVFETLLLQRSEQLTDLRVGVADAGVVAVTELAGLLGRDALVFGDACVSGEFEMIGIRGLGCALGSGAHAIECKCGRVIEVPVSLWRVEG